MKTVKKETAFHPFFNRESKTTILIKLLVIWSTYYIQDTILGTGGKYLV